MKLELNEIEKVKNIIEKGIVDNKPSETIRLLAKYYHKQNMNQEQIVQAINNFLIKNYKNQYNQVTWNDLLEGIVKTVVKNNSNLINISSVEITKSEVEYIKTLETDKIQRLIFTYLVYAKIFNKINSKNNNWVNGEYRNEIFKDAYIKETGKEQLKTIHKLVTNNILKISKNITNNSVNLEYVVKEDSETELIIDDFREFGLQWLKYLGDKTVYECNECKILFKQNIKAKKKAKLCKKCASKIKQENDKKRIKNIRNQNVAFNE